MWLLFFNCVVPVCVLSLSHVAVGFSALSYDVESGSKIMPCNKIDRPLVVYRFLGNVMTAITMLRTTTKL